MLSASGVRSYQDYTAAVARELRSRGVGFSAPRVLEADHYADICHPLGAGYAEVAKKLWEDEGFLNFLRSPKGTIRNGD